jgi:hypothetical protein
MVTTWNDIVYQALRDLKVVPAGGTASTSELADALIAMNTLIGSLSAQAIPIPFLTPVQMPLTGAQSYTLTTRPLKIEAATVILSVGVSKPIHIATSEEWFAFEDKSATGNFAQILFYDAVFPTPQVWLAPKPIAGNLWLQAYMPLAQIVAWTDAFSLPPGYDRMFIKLLAPEIADMFGAALTPNMMALAQDAKVSIQGLNAAVLGSPTLIVPPAPSAPVPAPRSPLAAS